MNETIRQHYVPRTYLKHFSSVQNGTYMIGFIPIDNVCLDAFKVTSVENICLEKNIYTLPGATVKERMWVEHLYSDLFEKDYDKVFDILIDPQKKTITSIERNLVISTVISMYYRNASWNRIIDDMTESIWARVYEMARANGAEKVVMQGEEISIHNKSLDQILSEEKAKSKPSVILGQVRQIMKLISIRSLRDQIMISKLEPSDNGYLASDNPVTCENISGRHIMPIDPTNLLSLPLDKMNHLSIIPNKPEWQHIVCRNSYSKDVEIIPKFASNSKQLQNANRFILGNFESFKGYFEDGERLKNPDKQLQRLIDLFYQIAKMDLKPDD